MTKLERSSLEAAIMAAITESLIEQNAPDSVSVYPIMDKVIAVLERRSRAECLSQTQ